MDDEILEEEDQGAPAAPESLNPIDDQLEEHRSRVAAAKEAREAGRKSPPEKP